MFTPRELAVFIGSIFHLFCQGFSSETQVVANTIAVDSAHDPVVLALNAASAAVATSDIPWNGPFGAVRVGYSASQQKFTVNPSRKQLHSADNR